jgi:hypothetical protein
MDGLLSHRVRHLIIGADAAPDPGMIGPRTQEVLGWPSRHMLEERAVQAVISGAEVTAVPADTPELVRADGTAAILRY